MDKNSNSLTETIDDLYDQLDMEKSDRVEEAGRSVAHLRD